MKGGSLRGGSQDVPGRLPLFIFSHLFHVYSNVCFIFRALPSIVAFSISCFKKFIQLLPQIPPPCPLRALFVVCSFFVVCYLLLAACCLLLVACRLLLAACCLLFAACCLLLVAACCLLLLLFAACCWLLVACCSLLAACLLRASGCCLLAASC